MCYTSVIRHEQVIIMDRFTSSLRSSIAHGDWYAALALALTLPDMCGKIDDPEVKRAKGSEASYARWFENWMAHNYTHRIGPEKIEHVFMSGTDLYALRCSYLHQGDGEISGNAQKRRNALDSFVFVQPPNGWRIHNNQSGRQLQLQVSVFCEEMADAVDAWYKDRCTDERVREAVASLLIIQGQDGKEISF